MRGLAIRALLFLVVLAIAMGTPAAQEIVDRIAVKIENDVILLSDVRTLGRGPGDEPGADVSR